MCHEIEKKVNMDNIQNKQRGIKRTHYTWYEVYHAPKCKASNLFDQFNAISCERTLNFTNVRQGFTVEIASVGQAHVTLPSQHFM